MGACALILLVLPATAQSQSDARLGAELTHHLSTMKKDRQVLRFLETHDWLLKDPRFAAEAKRQLQIHTSSLERARSKAAAARVAIARRAKARRLAAVAAASPPTVICRVFGLLLRPGPRRLAMRVRFAHRRPERAVSGPLSDGLERAPHLRAWPDRGRAGEGRTSVLRRVGQGLESLVLQALGITARHESSAKCGTRPDGRVPTQAATC